MENVRTNLIPPLNLGGFADGHPPSPRPASPRLPLPKFGFQNPQGPLAIAFLAPLAFHMDGEAGRQVNQPNGRLALVNILTARTTGASEVHFQFLGLDFHRRAFLELRQHFHQSEGSVPQLSGVERRNSNQTMNARLTLQCTISAAASHQKSEIAEAAVVVLILMEQAERPAAALGELAIHREEHRPPKPSRLSSGRPPHGRPAPSS